MPLIAAMMLIRHFAITRRHGADAFTPLHDYALYCFIDGHIRLPPPFYAIFSPCCRWPAMILAMLPYCRFSPRPRLLYAFKIRYVSHYADAVGHIFSLMRCFRHAAADISLIRHDITMITPCHAFYAIDDDTISFQPQFLHARLRC